MHLPAYGAGAMRSEGEDPRRLQKNTIKFKSKRVQVEFTRGQGDVAETDVGNE